MTGPAAARAGVAVARWPPQAGADPTHPRLAPNAHRIFSPDGTYRPVVVEGPARKSDRRPSCVRAGDDWLPFQLLRRGSSLR